jgi:hypothetical protein
VQFAKVPNPFIRGVIREDQSAFAMFSIIMKFSFKIRPIRPSNFALPFDFVIYPLSRVDFSISKL